jgi:hypothetical protein
LAQPFLLPKSCKHLALLGSFALLFSMAFTAISCDTNNFEEEAFPANFSTVLPGEQMAGVAVNSPYEALRIPLGRQDSFSLVPQLPGNFYAEWEDHGIGVLVEDSNLNGELDFDDPIREIYGFYPYRGRTPQDIGRNSSQSAVFDAYGEPDERSPGNQIWRYYRLGFDVNFFEGSLYQLKVYAPRL